jgi:hypothetical protein
MTSVNNTARSSKRDIREYAKPMVVLCSSRLAGTVNAAVDRYRAARRKPYSINTVRSRGRNRGTTIQLGNER